MKITMTLGGSRGDVQPCVALGIGLKAAGHEVCLAAPETFETLILGNGLDFHPTSLDPQEAVREALQGGDANPLEFAWRSRRILAPIIEENAREYLEACRGADVVIYTLVGFLGYGISRDLGIPRVGAMYGPLMNPARLYPSSFMPVFSGKLDLPEPSTIPGALKQLYNRLTYPVSQQILWQLLRAPANRALKAVPGLSPFSFMGPFSEITKTREPILNGWSPRILPQPPDWGPRIPVTGYWFVDRPEDWCPPEGLTDFLDSGPPPVSIGFGSMGAARSQELIETALDALKRAGRRGVLVTGWGGMTNTDLPDKVFKVDEVPHDWLFERVAAAVHHGGAGTTAASLRAGAPTVTVPFLADQSFWGSRVAALGAGPPPIPRSQLSAESLAQAIHQTEDSRMRERARMLGAGIQDENGVGRAVEEFHRFME